MVTIPPKLRIGDGVRVVAPSRSLALPWITEETRQTAAERLKEIGLTLSFGRHVNELDEFDSSPIESRIEDIHEAFEDPSVNLVLTAVGGYNSNELLPHLDYDLIRRHPKILCGYSDITALQNAICAKTGLVTYSGPHFFSFGERRGFDYTLEYFRRCLLQCEPFEVRPSEYWSNDRWSRDQENRNYTRNEGFQILNEGEAMGTTIGGNLVTFQSLQGTPYMPSLTDSVLFLEEDEEENLYTFNRNLISLTLNPGFSGVKGMVIGRLRPESRISHKDLLNMVKRNTMLRNIPIVANVDFGHTVPMITFPVGGRARVVAEGEMRLEILEH